MTCLRVLYSGHVQGVGFRATTREIAAGHEVAGYVKNLADGRVELVAEGEAEAVRRFLNAVKNRLGSHIAEASESEQSPRNLDGFRVER